MTTNQSDLERAAEEWATAKYGPTCDCKDGFIAGARWLLDRAESKAWMMDKHEEQRKAYRLVVLLAELKELVGEK